MKVKRKSVRPKVEEILRDRENWCLKFNEIENKFKEFGEKYANSDEKLFPILYQKFEEKREIQKSFIEKNLSNGKYDEKFEISETKLKGWGGFGAVFQALSKKGKRLYAIKVIAVNEKTVEKSYREILFMKAMDYDYIPKYIDSWIEQNNNNDYLKSPKLSTGHKIFDPHHYTHLIYIQMELCFETFKQTIERFNKPINVIEYYILSQLVIELLQCLNYLHNEFEPPIIHRDLKPSNILISYGMNGRFVKVADFGLATFHEFEGQSHTQGCGTDGYRSSKVDKGTKYDTEADIHSLKVTLNQIFDA
jgi:serine/threonine protein kinase